MKSLKLLQILILSFVLFVLLNIYENKTAEQEFNPVNVDEITPSCQIFIDGKQQITFDNLDKLELAINIPNSSGWFTNLFKASLGSLIIDNEYKKNFDSNLIVELLVLMRSVASSLKLECLVCKTKCNSRFWLYINGYKTRK